MVPKVLCALGLLLLADAVKYCCARAQFEETPPLPYKYFCPSRNKLSLAGFAAAVTAGEGLKGRDFESAAVRVGTAFGGAGKDGDSAFSVFSGASFASGVSLPAVLASVMFSSVSLGGVDASFGVPAAGLLVTGGRGLSPTLALGLSAIWPFSVGGVTSEAVGLVDCPDVSVAVVRCEGHGYPALRQ